MIVILLQKIFETLVNSFTSIKTKLTTLYENIEPPAPPTPALVWDVLLYRGVVYDGGEKTVSCPNIMDYEYIYVVVNEDLHVRGLDSHVGCKCIKTSDLTNDYNTMIGYLYGATNVYIKIVNKNAVNCYYSNNQKIFCNVYGSNTSLFELENSL